MNTMAHLPHPAGQNLLGEWTSPMCSPHSRGASHSLTLQNAPSGSTVTLGKWGSKTVPVGNRLRAATPYRTAQAVSNALQGNTTGRPRPCPTRCKETPPDGPGGVQRAARKHHRTAQAVSNALQGNTTGRPRPCPTRCKETPPPSTPGSR